MGICVKKLSVSKNNWSWFGVVFEVCCFVFILNYLFNIGIGKICYVIVKC